jgi:DNA adenine methylase
MMKGLNETPYSRSVFQSLKHSEPENEIEKAVKYFYLCRTSFAGDIKRGGFAVPSTTGRNPVQSFRNAVDSLDIIADRLKNVTIECLDYEECIRRYDSPESLFYVDPPYLNSEHYYGKDNFTLQDHYELSELLHGIKGQAMVSHYKNPVYGELYKDWNRYEYKSFKGSHKAKPGTEKPVTVECLYTNFEPQIKTRSLFDE